jgi:hypothetical protein
MYTPYLGERLMERWSKQKRKEKERRLARTKDAGPIAGGKDAGYWDFMYLADRGIGTISCWSDEGCRYEANDSERFFQFDHLEGYEDCIVFFYG